MKAALNVLDYCLIPATTSEATFWIARMLAHFPRKDTSGDGVVIADLAAAMIEIGASLVAIADVTERAWKAATRKNPFLPPSGAILNEVKEKTDYYRDAHTRLLNPRPAIAPPEAKAPASSWTGIKWSDMPVPARRDLAAFLKPLDREIALVYCRTIDVDLDAALAWFVP